MGACSNSSERNAMSESWLTPEHKLIEALLKQALAQRYQGFLDPCDAGSAYDCTILVPKRFEIKYDKKAAETGALYFEMHNTYRDTPSGLAVTQAEVWAHYLPHLRLVALYAPQRMRTFLQQALLQHRPGVRQTRPHGGDHNSQGVVAPIPLILAQPFVTPMPFEVELPCPPLALSGVIWRCQACRRPSAIEEFRMGYCARCWPEHQGDPYAFSA
jgi:hypothetical protein